MPTFQYCLLDGTSGQIEDIPVTCTVALIINELEQLHGMALHIVCVDKHDRVGAFGQSGLRAMGLELAPILEESKSITAVAEPSRPPLLLHKLPALEFTARCWYCLFARPSPKTYASEEDERLVLFLIIGLVHRRAISALAKGRRGAQLAQDIKLFVERTLVYDDGMCFTGLGGIRFAWQDPSITRVCLWRNMLAKALNWACSEQLHFSDPHWSRYSSEFPATIDKPQQFLRGLSQLRSDVFGVTVVSKDTTESRVWRKGRTKLPSLR